MKLKNSTGLNINHAVSELECYDASICPPPLNTKLFVISKYGVARIGTFDLNYDVAWFPLLRMPQTVKQRISND